MRDWTITDFYAEALWEGWQRAQVAGAGESWATHLAKFDGTVLPRDVDWSAYRKCSQVCRAPMGTPCFSQSGRIVNGHPDGVITVLPWPHVGRKRRTRKVSSTA